MKHVTLYSFISLISLVFVGCVFTKDKEPITPTASTDITFEESLNTFGDNVQEAGNAIIVNDVVGEKITHPYYYPQHSYVEQRTVKVFGQYFSPESGDRFSGYHTGDDIEVTDTTVEVPVYALTDSTIVKKDTISGYGGVIILEFAYNDQTYHALYGHLDLASVSYNVGDTLTGGTQLGMLGDDRSPETDGERKHLHFAIYPYTGKILFAGYVETKAELVQWVNPTEFLQQQYIQEPVDAAVSALTTEDIAQALQNINSSQ